MKQIVWDDLLMTGNTLNQIQMSTCGKGYL